MALWTAKVFVNSEVGEITATVEASTPHGASQQIKRIYGPVQQIVNLRQVNSGGGGSYSGGSAGCGTLFWLILGIVILSFFGGEKDDTKPRQQRSAAPVERVAKPYTPEPPKPMFRDYPTPPPSYCVTENFEPC